MNTPRDTTPSRTTNPAVVGHQQQLQHQQQQQQPHPQQHYYQQQPQPQVPVVSQHHHQQHHGGQHQYATTTPQESSTNSLRTVDSVGTMTTTLSSRSAGIEGGNNRNVKIIGGYALRERLGHGSFASVYKGVRVASAAPPQAPQEQPQQQQQQPETVAIKAIIRNERLSKKVLENLEVEISILRNYNHDNIVGLYSVTKTSGHFYLLLEYCGGGDLQRLIRSRKVGRLSERLTRRLMRDLTAGLRFLYEKQLIHRDIKPQNLLLTGSLPLDEIDDVGKSPSEEWARQREDYPSHMFRLKIADFGFARHLQTTSLAETLCGSPLYMAPEILQHQRYDAKADLWSAGTVLFEMISGRPPFNGENHIDLLRNIQRRAVRLPPGVTVSQQCVNLLRMLLNRNPLSRAGFDQFFHASDEFVALGCNGPPPPPPQQSETTGQRGGGPSSAMGTLDRSMALDRIVETPNENEGSPTNQAAAQGIASGAPAPSPLQGGQDARGQVSTAGGGAMVRSPSANHKQMVGSGRNAVQMNLISPDFGPKAIPTSSMTPGMPTASTTRNPYHMVQKMSQHQPQPPPSQFTPLVPSPPGPVGLSSPGIPPPLTLDGGNIMGPQRMVGMVGYQQQVVQVSGSHRGGGGGEAKDSSYAQHQQLRYGGGGHVSSQEHHQQQQPPSTTTTATVQTTSNASSQTSNSDNDEFVMVEHTMQSSSAASSVEAVGVVPPSVPPSSQQQQQQQQQHQRRSFSTSVRNVIGAAAPSLAIPLRGSGNEGMVHVQQHQRQPYRGMLSTSPGTGGALMGAMMGRTTNAASSSSVTTATRETGVSDSATDAFVQIGSIGSASVGGLEAVAKMLRTAEDVGRRAVNVAHLGDTRAYLAMRVKLSALGGASSSSSLLSSTPMDCVPEEGEDGNEVRSESSPSSDKVSKPQNQARGGSTAADEDEDDEMPFALAPSEVSVSSNAAEGQDRLSDIAAPPAPSRNSPYYVSQPSASTSPGGAEPTPTAKIHAHFREALCCYLKSLPMMKGAVTAAQRVMDAINCDGPIPSGDSERVLLANRCELSLKWLASQFHGILERADAANSEVGKLASKLAEEKDQEAPILSVEELIYNHSLACGRDGAVKQLLGQYDTSRICYRSAGLLAETLMMEPRIGADDRKILQGYVIGFAERIQEIDRILQHGSTVSVSVVEGVQTQPPPQHRHDSACSSIARSLRC